MRKEPAGRSAPEVKTTPAAAHPGKDAAHRASVSLWMGQGIRRLSALKPPARVDATAGCPPSVAASRLSAAAVHPPPSFLPAAHPPPPLPSHPSSPEKKNQRVFGNTRRTYAARCLDKSNCRRQKRKSDKVTQQFIHHCCVTLPLRNPHTDEAAYPRSLLPKRAIIFSLAGPLGSGLAEHGGPGPARPWGGIRAVGTLGIGADSSLRGGKALFSERVERGTTQRQKRWPREARVQAQRRVRVQVRRRAEEELPPQRSAGRSGAPPSRSTAAVSAGAPSGSRSAMSARSSTRTRRVCRRSSSTRGQTR